MSNMILSIFNKIRNLSRTTIIILIIIVILIIGGYFIFKPKPVVYSFIKVAQQSITETVSVTGNTTPISSVSLGFGNSGNIAHIYSAVGNEVTKGQVLAELNTADLYAQIKQAEANVDANQAKLDGLIAGSRPEDIAAFQASLDKSKQDLTNTYNSILDSSNDSFNKANDAVRTQLSQFFTNNDSSNVSLTYITVDSQSKVNAEMGFQSAKKTLDTWQTELNTINNTTSNDALEKLLQDDLNYLSAIHQLLDNVSKTLQFTTGLDASTLTLYKTNLTVALNEVNGASTNINTIIQGIASQKLIIAQLQAELDLKKAGSTLQDIAAAKAQVENAKAGVQSIEAKLQNSQIIAPISGVITQFDAKIGEFTTPGVILISIISQNSFEVDALVSETDIGKLAINNKVSMTLDAFQGETFTGTVFYIDPAQTLTNGVVGYKIKIAFDKVDLRMKSGLTANLDITTRSKDNVLVLPQYAILQNDQGTFVEILENKIVKDIPVVLGIQDQNGNVEIISGVTAGEEVLNIGLK